MATKKSTAGGAVVSAAKAKRARKPSKLSPAAVSEAKAIKETPKDRVAASAPVSEAPSFDPLIVSELIEVCRAHVASLVELADVTARGLCECYEYEDDEPHLWQCCHLIRQVLIQVQAALIPLGVVSHEADPLTRAAEIAEGCEEQRQLLCPSVHVIRASVYILRGMEPNHHDQFLPALRDLESGISTVIDGLERAIQGSLCGKQPVTPP